MMAKRKKTAPKQTSASQKKRKTAKKAGKRAADTSAAVAADGRANRKGPVEAKEVRRQLAALETLIGRI